MKYIYLFLFLLIPASVFGAITFTDGQWETTFDCAPYEQKVNTLNCDGLSPGLTDGEQYDGDPIGTGCKTGNEEINSRANYPGGLGGLGQVHKACGTMSPIESKNSSSSGGVGIVFPSPQTELWIRWYMKLPLGFAWVGDITSNKILFINGSPQDAIVKWQYTNSFGVGLQGSGGDGLGSIYYDDTSGWTTTMGGTTGDGQWHYYEVHIKSGATDNTGVAEFWIDNRAMVARTDVEFYQSTFVDIRIGSNFHGVDGLGYEIFYDDITVYNTTPPNTDGDGNAYIGPIGAVPGGSSTAVTGGGSTIITTGSGSITGD